MNPEYCEPEFVSDRKRFFLAPVSIFGSRLRGDKGRHLRSLKSQVIQLQRRVHIPSRVSLNKEYQSYWHSMRSNKIYRSSLMVITLGEAVFPGFSSAIFVLALVLFTLSVVSALEWTSPSVSVFICPLLLFTNKLWSELASRAENITMLKTLLLQRGEDALRESCDSVREKNKFHTQKYKKEYCESQRIRILEKLLSYS